MIMLQELKIFLLWLAMVLPISSQNDNSFNKYLSIKESSGNFVSSVILGMYENYLITFWNNNIYMTDVDTGRPIKTILGSFSLGGSKATVVMSELINDFVVIYFSDNRLQQWDLDTGKIVREQKLFRDSSSIVNCATNITSNLTFCCLLDGNVRRINLMTERIEAQFQAHPQACYIHLNDSFVYTSSFDGLVKRFGSFGTPLATYELSLGYAYILGFENEFIFALYYNINVDLRNYIVRWNAVTGIGEEFPLQISNMLSPPVASKDYYFATTFNEAGVAYAQIFKNNLTIARANTDGEIINGARFFAVNGDRFFFCPNSTIYELFPSDEGLVVGTGIDVNDYTIPMFDFIALNDTTMIVVYERQPSKSYYVKLLDLRTGIFSANVEMFEEHLDFQIVDDLVVAAVGKEIVAYHLNDLRLAWKSPEIAPEKILLMRYQEGLIYYATRKYAGCHNASTFQPVGVIITLKEGFYGRPAFLNQVLYDHKAFNSIIAYGFSDGLVVRQYGAMSNLPYAVRINGDYIYAANADRNIYKFDLNNAGLVLIFTGHSRDVNDVIFRGQFMYSCSNDITIRKWNIDTGESLFTYFGHTEFVFRIYWRSNTLYSLSSREIITWDLARERLLKTYFNKSSIFISLYATGKDLITCSIGGTLVLWNLENGRKVSELYRFEEGTYITGSNYFNDSIIFSKSSGTIMKFNRFSDDVVEQISGRVVEELSAFSVHQDLIFAFGKSEGLAVKNITSQVVKRLKIQSFYSNALLVVGDFLFSGNNDTTITKFDAKTLAVVTTIKAHTGAVTVLGQFYNQLISGSDDNSLRTWNIDDLNLVLDLKRDSTRLGHLGPIASIHVEGENLFSGSADTTVKRWDLITGKVLFTYTGHSKRVTRVFVNNGTLFTTGEDEIIQLYNVIAVSRPSATTFRTTAATAARMPPVTSREPQESASISGVILGIIIGAAVVLLISLWVSCRLLLVKTSTWHESPTVAKTSDIERTNNTTLQGMTLAPTNIGISIPASKSVNETDFIITGQLGKGGGGDVFFATPRTNSLRKYGERIVAKRFKKTYNSMNPNEKSMFDQEIGIMEMLGGRGHFAELIGYALNPCTILMKLYSLGSLSSFMKKMDALWPKTVIMSFAQDIFVAVGIMHKLELAHCDLKPDNILIDKNHSGRYTCVLTDFGITQILSDSIIDAKAFIAFNVRGLSVRYAAPEAFLRFRTKSEYIKANEMKAGDLYSLATIVYEMLTRRHPWA